LPNEGGVAGSDFPAISPVINWLLDMYHESKEENKLRYRKFSTIRYSKVFRLSAKVESVSAFLCQESKSNDRKDTLIDQEDHIPGASNLQNKKSTAFIKVISVVKYWLTAFVGGVLRL
jgi:CCDC93, coiled-coil domain